MHIKNNDDIVITGIGAVSPVGIGVTQYWDNLVNGKSGIGHISRFDPSELAVKIAAEVKEFHPQDFMPRKLVNQTDAFTQFAYAAASEALDGQTIDEPDRFAIIVGTSLAGIETIARTQDALTRATHKNVGPKFVPRILGNIAASHIAIGYGLTGTSLTISTACASGNDAIISAGRLLRCNEAEMALAVGTESILCPLVIYSLANAGSLSKENDLPQRACRPFDLNRSGFVIGEGGGALLLETREHAENRGAEIYATLRGWASNNDAYHIATPLEDGAKAAQCIEGALRMSALDPDDIDYINAHGTGTISGDSAEASAIEKVFGSVSPLVGSTKGATGHMMGAGGVTEAIACIKVIQTGVVPPTLNLDQPAFDLDFVQNRQTDLSVKVAMSNAFGFGGQNSTIVLTV